jgi:hypothetical protein
MIKLLQIGFIWLGCAVAWSILGSTIVARSGTASSGLAHEVQQLWGPELRQAPPRAWYVVKQSRREQVTRPNASGEMVTTETVREVEEEVALPLEGSQLAVRLELDHRRKGLMWFPTYGVAFQGRYTFANPSPAAQEVRFLFPLTEADTVYDGFAVRAVDGAPVTTQLVRARELNQTRAGKAVSGAVNGGAAEWAQTLQPGERRTFEVGYRARGTSRWDYELGAGTGEVRNLHLALDTDFRAVDFPAGTLSPSLHRPTATGWHGEWRFASLIAARTIGVQLPQRLNPGPLASKITFFAPVGLLFFFFVVAILGLARERSLHPLNYFFFGCAFFAFHLLFAYLVDHLAVAPSFLLAAGVSTLLVVSYARLFVGWRFALRDVGLAQLIYLVLFSFTFFWEGFTGLAVTVGAIVTLFVLMQITGRQSFSLLRRAAAAGAAQAMPALAPVPAVPGSVAGFGPPGYGPAVAPMIFAHPYAVTGSPPQVGSWGPPMPYPAASAATPGPGQDTGPPSPGPCPPARP